jgi:uncharacterized glyoxalase superfamily protein PhnB
MRPPPAGWPRISTALYYDDPGAAIDWLCAAFGFTLQLKIDAEDGGIEHSELRFGEGLVMVSRAKPDKFPKARSPSQAGGGNTQNLMVYVDDVEAHFARARAAGATIVKPPTSTDYGEDYWEDRGYEVEDPGGHRWWFYQRVREVPSKESR